MLLAHVSHMPLATKFKLSMLNPLGSLKAGILTLSKQ